MKTGATRKEGRPVVFVVGDSTVKNQDKDEDGLWGWGSVIAKFFDPKRVSVENWGKPGSSARSFTFSSLDMGNTLFSILSNGSNGVFIGLHYLLLMLDLSV